MTKKNAKKIGFFSALAVLIGSVIGIGIFFKNGSIFAANANNGYGVLVSWILASLIAISTAFSFGEISSSTSSEAGLAEWSSKFVGNKFGKFVKFTLPTFYFGALIVTIFLFTSESAFNIFTIFNPDLLKDTNMGYVFLIAIVLFLFFLVVNIFYKNGSTKAQIVLTSTKFLPLFATIIIGFSFFQSSSETFVPNNLFSNSKGDIDFSGILMSLPAILFAFDSFLSVGSLSSEMKNGEKKIPIVIIVGMVTCSSIYLLITIVQILIGQGIINNFYLDIFSYNPELAKWLSFGLNIFIFLSALGVCNGLVIVALRNYDYLVKHRIIFNYVFYTKLNNKFSFLGSGILFLFYSIFWYIVILIPSVILDNDTIIDGVSNFPTLFFFLIYGIIVLYGIKNRLNSVYKIKLNKWRIIVMKEKVNKIQVNKLRFFMFFSVVSFIGIVIAIGYQLLYANFVLLIQEPEHLLSWGSLFSKGSQLKAWEGSIVFFGSLILFFTFPKINDLLFFAERKIHKFRLDKISKQVVT